MKYALSIFLGLILTTLVGVFVAHAQDYTPLAPLPGTFTGATGSETTNISTYLGGMLKLLIALGAGVSILVAIIGGTQYVAAGIAPSAKQDAKDRILNAFIGLTLVLTSYLILNSINPGLVQFNFSLPPIGTSPMATTTAPTAVTGEPKALTAAEASLRNSLSTAGISIERVYACEGMTYQSFSMKYPGKGCTTIEGLPAAAINDVITLRGDCGCAVIITGGAEAGHITHGSGINNIDLKKGSALNTFILNGVTPVNPEGGCGLKNANHYHRSDGVYVDEGTHWHVCY